MSDLIQNTELPVTYNNLLQDIRSILENGLTNEYFGQTVQCIPE